MSSARVLVVDDAPEIRNLLKRTLTGLDHTVELAGDGIEGVQKARAWRPDLILLDLAMPRMGGLTACEQIREFSSAPIIVLSVMGEEQDKVRALDAGADDYITKPFGMQELMARIRVALRRAGGAPAQLVFSCDDLTVDMGVRRVTVGGQVVHLTPIEYSVLSYLVTNAGRVLTHTQILSHAWGPEYASELQYLRSFIGQLRKKLGDSAARPHYILTEPGVGYRLRSPDWA
ncbi:MAG TPA: response regulator transcription factor [Chloroflexota bacterium]|jgi:two-component system KDP operon response regulator KdpE|nr:response regulator transcription factor [Chloroflexota bacterium]